MRTFGKRGSLVRIVEQGRENHMENTILADVWMPPADMYPTICGFCGRGLTEGEDGLMHCVCPRWMEGPEAGLDRDPEAYAGWKSIKDAKKEEK